ncbi:hypothetical protein ABET51_22195 [Metabacillus fastidiosus]|uniref:hypothetical protein n=1 Tax=Metabacillus fastidiosus TaxID=1458 RepID=UPI002E24D049|nr:hypothetical protein [Metabacillus fastidiosus]
MENVRSVKLFQGEKWLVITGITGLLLAAGIAIFIFINGSIVEPEGNLANAFSFNAAVAIFILTIAAILPFSQLDDHRKQRVRLHFFLIISYFYLVETIQHFRGINPRFSRAGSIIDMIIGISFGIVSLLIVILLIKLMIQFFRTSIYNEHFILSIRYSFISIMLALVAGIWMIVIQDRYFGTYGNFIVLHGLGFHALQLIVVQGWFLMKAEADKRKGNLLLHIGGSAWIISMCLIGIQTVLGESIFQMTLLPIISGFMLVVWLITAFYSFWMFMKAKSNFLTVNKSVSE